MVVSRHLNPFAIECATSQCCNHFRSQLPRLVYCRVSTVQGTLVMDVEQHHNAMKHAAEPTNINKEASSVPGSLSPHYCRIQSTDDFIRSNSFLYRIVLPPPCSAAFTVSGLPFAHSRWGLRAASRVPGMTKINGRATGSSGQQHLASCGALHSTQCTSTRRCARQHTPRHSAALVVTGSRRGLLIAP